MSSPYPQERFRRAQLAYEQVQDFVETSSVVDDYRRSPLRPSALALEVRKDLVCQFDPDTGKIMGMRNEEEERATEIARVIAESITIFLETDREERLRADS